MTFWYGASISGNGGCCVQDEIQNFVINEGENAGTYRDYLAKGETPEKAAKHLLEKIINRVREDGWSYSGSQIRFFWFVKGTNAFGKSSGEWNHHELRDVVKDHPKVRSLGEHRNANTGNEVAGYMLEINDIEGENDDE